MPIGGLVAYGIIRAFARRPRTMPRELLLDRLPLPDPARPHVRWSQLHGSGLSLAAAEAAARHGGTVCVIAPSAAAADRIERELEFFGGAPVRRFPSYESCRASRSRHHKTCSPTACSAYTSSRAVNGSRSWSRPARCSTGCRRA